VDVCREGPSGSHYEQRLLSRGQTGMGNTNRERASVVTSASTVRLLSRPIARRSVLMSRSKSHWKESRMRSDPYQLRLKVRSFGLSNLQARLRRAASQLNIERIVSKEIEGGPPDEFGNVILPRRLRRNFHNTEAINLKSFGTVVAVAYPDPATSL
jgi:hypothetical protein